MSWRLRSRTSAIVLSDSSGIETIAKLRVSCRDKGLLDIGHHYVVEAPEGRVVCMRPHACMGSHLPGRNHSTIGVCLIGGGDGGDTFTEDQLVNAGRLLGFLQDAYLGCPVVGRTEVLPGGRRNPALDMHEFRRTYMGTAVRGTRDTPETTDATQAGKDGLGPQSRFLLEHLMAGNAVTQLIAIGNLGIGSLTKRIAEIRQAIGPERIHSQVKHDAHSRRYVSYTYVPAEPAVQP